MDRKTLVLEMAVCALVTAAFTNIYITQPILPVLEAEFSVSTVRASLTVSLVILGIVASNLFFGYLSDRMSIRPILAVGAMVVAAGGLFCALTRDFNAFAGARLLQGLFIPALTTSLAAWLSKNLPQEKLSVVMGTYVAATVLGGFLGRLLGGWIHPPLHWRYAFFSVAGLTCLATVLALWALPRQDRGPGQSPGDQDGFRALIRRTDLFLLFCVGGAGLFMFSPVFNYLSYRLSAPPFGFSTEVITLVYLITILGMFLGPAAGKMSMRLGGGMTMILGSLVLGIAFCLLLIPAVWAVMAGLTAACAGFFTIHATAVGLLNGKLSRSQGRANALYILFYYTGGWLGITVAGFCYEVFGWTGVVLGSGSLLVVPLYTGVRERKNQ